VATTFVTFVATTFVATTFVTLDINNYND